MHTRSRNKVAKPREANLREAFPSQNMMNRGTWKWSGLPRHVNSTAAGGFNVVVMAKYFGTFPTIEEAKAVALKAAADLQGEWSYTASRQRPMRRLAWAK